MTLVYQLTDLLLPFDFLTYHFMKHAFWATILIAPCFALFGTMAVNNKMAFFSDALGHSAFTGIALGVLLGLRQPVFSMLAFGIFMSLIICRVKAGEKTSTDTVISVFSSVSMALGIVILSKNGGFAKFSTYLIGDILTISPSEVLLVFIMLIISYILWYKIYNHLLLVSINTSLASSRGIHTFLIENLFVVAVATAVMISIQWIGILTINSLLILPAAAARNIASNAKQYHLYSTAIGLCSGIAGLILSYYIDTSAGATMVLCASFMFAVTFLLGKKYQK